MRARSPHPNEVFGQHLRALRQTKKLTQEQLAERADLGVNIVGRLERSVIAPGLVSILKLSVALGVPAKDMLDPFTPELVAQMKLGARAAVSRRPRTRR
jgi:transcriptional regulator with XRE-family HTH domain